MLVTRLSLFVFKLFDLFQGTKCNWSWPFLGVPDQGEVDDEMPTTATTTMLTIYESTPSITATTTQTIGKKKNNPQTKMSKMIN